MSGFSARRPGGRPLVHADCWDRERPFRRLFSRGGLRIIAEVVASRYVFTADVSVDEVQAFIRDLVRVMGWFTSLGPYGR